MGLHQTSGRWRVGLLLALSTMGLWATLPIALKIALETLDPWTLTWFRFAVAASVMLAWLAWTGQLRQFGALGGGHWGLLAVAAAGLIGNYVTYLLGLDFTTPANAQLLIQLAPLLMTLGGVIVFRERLALGQRVGFGFIVAGLLLFFADQQDANQGARYLTGAVLIVVAAVTWAVYALAQKQLLVRLPSSAIMAFIYVTAAIVLAPMARPSALVDLDRTHQLVLAYCALNTLAAYGAFAESLAHWDASRIGAVLAVTPLFTLLIGAVVAALIPGLVAPERIAFRGWMGAVLVVGGAAAASLLARRYRPVPVRR
ncbi:MAG: DMT family transporter [Vicinamibacterales bacterium]